MGNSSDLCFALGLFRERVMSYLFFFLLGFNVSQWAYYFKLKKFYSELNSSLDIVLGEENDLK